MSYNVLQKKKNSYFHVIQEKMILYITCKNTSLFESFNFQKKWEREVVVDILLHVSTVLKGKEEFARIAEISDIIGLTNELREAIKHEKWWISAEATRKAGKLKLTCLEEIITENLFSDNYDLWMTSARALSFMNQHKLLILFFMKNEKKIPKWSVMRMVDMFKNISEADCQFLIANFDELSPIYQGLLIEVLGKRKIMFALHHIEAFLESENFELRLKSMKAIAELGITSQSAKVKNLLTSESWIEKVNSILIIKNCNIKEALNDIAALVSDQNWWVRYRAAEALFSFGERGITTLEHIKYFHKDSYARDMAERILLDKSLGVL